MDKFTILLIDDSPLIQKIVKKVLEGQYRVIAYSSWREVCEQLDEVKPDLILLDVEMPETDGFEVLVRLKERNVTQNIPIIFLTSKTDVDFEFKALELGAVDYINKPFANSLLLKRVEIHLSHAIQKRALANYNDDLQERVREKTKIIKELQYAIVFTLADLVEMRDNTTGGHVLRTQEYFKLILDYLDEHGIYQEELKGIEQNTLLEASQLHDIGKVAIPDAILLKPAKLTAEEFEIMKNHTIIGYNTILHAMDLTTDKDFLQTAAEVAYTHHEKWDGTGYPRGLAGSDIPIAGRIMAIVDVYDALVSERPYKKKMTHAQAMKILLEGRGTHFDPVLIDAIFEVQSKFEDISKTK